MKQKLWITLAACLAYCIDKELYKAIDYLQEQVRVLVEHQEKQDKRIRLTNSQRMRVAAKAKRLSRKMLEQCTELFLSIKIQPIATILEIFSQNLKSLKKTINVLRFRTALIVDILLEVEVCYRGDKWLDYDADGDGV